jgi:hypothetical protein
MSPHDLNTHTLSLLQLDRLEESFRYVEERVYNLILARMKELGGCKCWDWKPQHIEAQLVKMGLVEATVDDKTGTRRRKQKMARRRANTINTPPHHMAMHHHHPAMHMAHHPAMQPQHHMTPPHVMNDWTGGLGVPMAALPMSRHPSYDAHLVMAQAPEDLSPPPMVIPPPTFTTEEEESYLDQIFHSGAKPQGDSSMSPEDMNSLAFDDEDVKPALPTPGIDGDRSVHLMQSRIPEQHQFGQR